MRSPSSSHPSTRRARALGDNATTAGTNNQPAGRNKWPPWQAVPLRRFRPLRESTIGCLARPHSDSSPTALVAGRAQPAHSYPRVVSRRAGRAASPTSRTARGSDFSSMAPPTGCLLADKLCRRGRRLISGSCGAGGLAAAQAGRHGRDTEAACEKPTWPLLIEAILQYIESTERKGYPSRYQHRDAPSSRKKSHDPCQYCPYRNETYRE